MDGWSTDEGTETPKLNVRTNTEEDQNFLFELKFRCEQFRKSRHAVTIFVLSPLGVAGEFYKP